MQFCIAQRKNAAAFGRCTFAGAEIAEIVHGCAESDLFEAAFLRQRDKLVHQFGLAEIAAVGGVGHIVRILHLVRTHQPVLNTDALRYLLRLRQLCLW